MSFIDAIRRERAAWAAVKDRLPGSPDHDPYLWRQWKAAAQDVTKTPVSLDPPEPGPRTPELRGRPGDESGRTTGPGPRPRGTGGAHGARSTRGIRRTRSRDGSGGSGGTGSTGSTGGRAGPTP